MLIFGEKCYKSVRKSRKIDSKKSGSRKMKGRLGENVLAFEVKRKCV